MDKFQVVKGFAGREVQIVRSGTPIKVDLDNATKQQLALLFKLKHPAVEAVKQPPKKGPKEAK